MTVTKLDRLSNIIVAVLFATIVAILWHWHQEAGLFAAIYLLLPDRD